MLREAARWLLRLTPAAGFVQQALQEFPQVVAHYAAGYFPLPGWAGFAVLVAYTAALLGLATLRLRHRTTAAAPRPT